MSVLSSSVDPVTLMISECMTISLAMRKVSLWSQTGMAAILGAGDLFVDDEAITRGIGFGSSGSRHAVSNDNPLLSSFIQLRSMLTDSQDVCKLDSLTLLQPFLMVIKSSSTSGRITALALSSLQKFIRYDIINIHLKNVQNAMVQIVTSLTHCRFEAADQNSDDAVLLKVLRLLELILESPLSNLLPNEIVSEVVQTCLSLACNKKRSEVLRRAAEMTMALMTLRIFSQLRIIEPPKHQTEDEIPSSFDATKLPEDVIGAGGPSTREQTPALSTKDSKEEPESDAKEHENSAEIPENKEPPKTGTEVEAESVEPFGLHCITELMSILISMIAPSNQYQHMESTRVFALVLINNAIEVSGRDIPRHSPLMVLVSDSVAKHVLQIITTTESPPLLEAALQLFTTMAIVLGDHLKAQLELTLTLLFRTILPEAETKSIPEKQKSNQSNLSVVKSNDSSITSRSAASKERLVESLSLLWTRSPLFFTNLFIDFDCNFERSDLALLFLNFLCNLSLPESAIATTDNVPPLCLEGILTFIGGVNERIKQLPDGQDLDNLPIHDFIKNKEMKTSFIKCTDKFNVKPKEGIKQLAEKGFIKDANDPDSLAAFFFERSGRLNKKTLGEFLAKPENIEVLKAFINRFDFSGSRPDEALRMLLKAFRLPGEAQQIDRVVECFADRYVSCLEAECEQRNEKYGKDEKEEGKDIALSDEEEPVYPTRDAVFILSFSIILLNTDLHSSKIKKQMDFDAYKTNLRGFYYGGNFPPWYLSKIYNSIKDREIIMPEEHHGTDKWFDDAWNNMIATQARPSASLDIQHSNQSGENTVGSSNKYDLLQICQFDQYLFQNAMEKIIHTLVSVFNSASDDHVITRLMASIDKCANICMYSDHTEAIDTLIGLLAELTLLTKKQYRIGNLDENMREDIPITQLKIDKKDNPITVSEMAVFFGRDFKAQISTVVLFRLVKKTGCKVTDSWTKVVKVILTILENCLLDPNLFVDFQRKVNLTPLPKVKPKYIINRVKPLNNSGIFSTFSSFLKGYSDDPPEPSDQEIESTLSTIDCINSLNIPAVLETVAKGDIEDLKKLVYFCLDNIPDFDSESKRYYEPEVLFIFEISVCFLLLLDDQEVINDVLSQVSEMKDFKEFSKKGVLRLCSYTFLLLRKSNNLDSSPILTSTIQKMLSLEKELISKHGSQALKPLLSLVDDDTMFKDSLMGDEDFWKLLRSYGSIPVHSKEVFEYALSLVKLNISGVNSKNYMPFLALLDELSSLGAAGSRLEQENERRVKAGEETEKESELVLEILEVSKKSISLTAELASIKSITEKELKNKEFGYSLIQALAHQCFNPCREIRSYALTTSQPIIMTAESAYDGITPLGVFEFGLFPLLTELSKPEVLQTDPNGFLRTHAEVLSLVGKVFLKYYNTFSGEELEKVWLRILDGFIALQNLESKFSKNKEPLRESGSEVLKNMVLVLNSADVLVPRNEALWNETWSKIDGIFPELREEVKTPEVTEKIETSEPALAKEDGVTPAPTE